MSKRPLAEEQGTAYRHTGIEGVTLAHGRRFGRSEKRGRGFGAAILQNSNAPKQEFVLGPLYFPIPLKNGNLLTETILLLFDGFDFRNRLNSVIKWVRRENADE